MESFVPVCFFKTKVEVLDDDQDWLSAFDLAFSDKGRIEISSDAELVIQRINESEKLIDSLSEYNLPKILNNNDRYNIISEIVSDFVMPGCDGIEIFDKLEHTWVRKILMSAFVNYTSVCSFRKLYSIDSFLSKDIIMFGNKFKEILSSVSYKFFVSIFSKYLQNHKNLSNILSNNNFFETFDKLVCNNDIVEFYSVDDNGSYIMKSAEGKRCEFVMLDEQTVIHSNKVFAEVLNNVVPEYIFMHPLMLRNNDELITEKAIANENSRFFETTKIVIDDQIYYYSFNEGNFFFKNFQF